MASPIPQKRLTSPPFPEPQGPLNEYLSTMKFMPMIMLVRRIAWLCAVSLIQPLWADWTVAIPPAAARHSSVPRLLKLELPGADLLGHYEATGRGLKRVPVQSHPESPGTFLVQMPAHFSGSMRVKPVLRRRPLASAIQISTNDHRLEFRAGGRLLMGFQSFPGTFPRSNIKPIFRRGGYFHPLVTPSGRWVTDDFPTNHVHHHGVWFAWTNTRFDGRTPDFWNMGDGKGLVEFVELNQLDAGPLHARLRSTQRYQDLTSGAPVNVLIETWDASVVAPMQPDAPRVLDLDVQQNCASEKPLFLPEYRYGGIGIRGAGSWDGIPHARFLTSNGESDRVKAHATRAKWCAMWGRVDGRDCGIAVLAHPGNFRAPEPIRVHPSEPFLNFAPSQAGDFEIKPGATHRARYRLVVFDGAPDPASLDQAWNDYAAPGLRGVPGR